MELAGLEQLWKHVPAISLVLTRIGTLFVSAPLFGGPFAPARVKVLLSLSFHVVELSELSRSGVVVRPVRAPL